MERTIKITDTTLRDGEQMPGVSMNVGDKIRIATLLEKLGVDYIEAGFPASSANDFRAVERISELVATSTVTALARASKPDIEAAAKALANAQKKRIHVFIATSDIHLEHKLRMTRSQLLDTVAETVTYAKSFADDVEFSAEDASRSDIDFLCSVYKLAAENGASCINIPDTVGYSVPEEFALLVKTVKTRVCDEYNLPLSVHCHNDLGLAVANSLAALQAGADAVECTVNGLGERAGNAALEEIVMAINTRSDFLSCKTNIVTSRLYKTSEAVAGISGVYLAPNKAIVGKNAFSHQAGIHQHGVLADRHTYEIMTPQSVGITESNLVLGKLSGHHAFEEKLKELDIAVDSSIIDSAFGAFKDLACRKKTVSDADIRALVEDAVMDSHVINGYELEGYQTQTGDSIKSMAMITVSRLGSSVSEAAVGEGPIDASFNSLNRIVGKDFLLVNYEIKAVTGGTDALGEVRVRISDGENEFVGKGISTDIIKSSIRAYINAVNRALFANTEQK